MPYKTIVLSLLEQRPVTYRRLRERRQVPAALDLYSTALKAAHLHWSRHLARTTPGRDDRQVAAEAMELAIADLLAGLPPESSAGDGEPPLAGAEALLRRHTPPE